MKPGPGAALLCWMGLVVPAAAGQRAYAVVPAESQVLVHVGRAGLLKFAGHEHEVAAPVAAGEVIADSEDLARSSVTVAFEAAMLRVTGRGEPAKDVPKVQEKMLGPDVLDVARHPAIHFRSTAVSGRAAGPGRWDLQVSGDLTLRGITRRVTLPLAVEASAERLTAIGQTVIRHTDYGMKPVSVAGVVKVKNELTLEFRIVGQAR